MEDGRVYARSNMTVVLQNDSLPCSSEVLQSLWFPNSSPSFHGDSGSCSTSMINFEDVGGTNPTDRPFFPLLEKEEDGNEDYGFHQPEKKRRLRADQVQFLERSFEVENKLEPEKKAQLAKEIGLKPRQVAIWFQNRRARFKTKRLEKDYDALKANYDRLKADYEGFLKEQDRLRNEVLLLTNKLILREKDVTISEQSDPIHPMVEEAQKKVPNFAASDPKSETPMVVFKQEEATSAKSDVLDSEQSDFSQDEEGDLARTLLPLPCLPKLEDEYYNEPPPNGYNWNFLDEGGQPSWLWPY
ncbi:Homeobox-leucine zipper protein [Actinidia chinensis var. chinensis]|uniref:Homeobox-leucine zipper protein n=1 Tax=Actinidia chinensis var. chinensis TaxID=1590841 RepID=A0A2R6RFB5_ACTCC|nr:Homeobox-leucine zipper protein [Actinidia chinensis var. chinensis]